jgi:hypothetical protein
MNKTLGLIPNTHIYIKKLIQETRRPEIQEVGIQSEGSAARSNQGQ